MRIATWNVNSLSVRLPQVLDWLAANPVDALGLQELKLTDDKFPHMAFEEAGYKAVSHGQKTYNGVAWITRDTGRDVVCNIPGFDDEQARVIAATIDDVRVVCAYCVNGEAVDSDKYRYKLEWFARLHAYLAAERERHPKLVLTGDFNIAPDDRDVHDPAAWAGQILCSDAERSAFQRLQALGLHDSFRLFEQPEKTFSWWDYRMLGFQKNLGLRIDHVLLSRPLAELCSAAGVDRAPRKLERPSDHAPVWTEIGQPA